MTFSIKNTYHNKSVLSAYADCQDSLNAMLSSPWPYQQTLDWAKKACQENTLAYYENP